MHLPVAMIARIGKSMPGLWSWHTREVSRSLLSRVAACSSSGSFHCCAAGHSAPCARKRRWHHCNGPGSRIKALLFFFPLQPCSSLIPPIYIHDPRSRSSILLPTCSPQWTCRLCLSVIRHCKQYGIWQRDRLEQRMRSAEDDNQTLYNFGISS